MPLWTFPSLSRELLQLDLAERFCFILKLVTFQTQDSSFQHLYCRHIELFSLIAPLLSEWGFVRALVVSAQIFGKSAVIEQKSLRNIALDFASISAITKCHMQPKTSPQFTFTQCCLCWAWNIFGLTEPFFVVWRNFFSASLIFFHCSSQLTQWNVFLIIWFW